MKLAVVVHGRFHAFDLARALIEREPETVLFTNYPKHIVKRFGVSPAHVKSFLPHGILSRVVAKTGGSRMCEPMLHKMFGRWAARQLGKQPWDVIHSFTGISEEILTKYSKSRVLNSIMRGSAHIETQMRLLEEEEARAGVSIEKPSRWMIEREKREYAAAKIIILLSSFAQQSFLERGVAAKKLHQVPLGSEVKRFRPGPEVVENRCRRVLSGEPLRVLTIGTFSYRKGALDLIEMAQRTSPRIRFRFVGDLPDETKQLRLQVNGRIEFKPRQPQYSLPQEYAQGDLFVFPTIEDGFAAVLAQAQAAGLPVLATTNCAAPDLIKEDQTGWVLPIRKSDAFVQRLEWCEAHRTELAGIVKGSYEQFRPRDWSNVASDLLAVYSEWLSKVGS
jgi:glycosyltransferase involved in cell wall biosynthesis